MRFLSDEIYGMTVAVNSQSGYQLSVFLPLTAYFDHKLRGAFCYDRAHENERLSI